MTYKCSNRIVPFHLQGDLEDDGAVYVVTTAAA